MEKDIQLLQTACALASVKVRDTISSLRGSPIGMKGLSPSLKSLARDVQSQTRVEIRAHVEDVGEPPPTTVLAVYQVVKEALLNAIKHSRASIVDVRVSAEPGVIRVCVEDDGIGFDPDTECRNHFGLLIMRERAEAVGGMLHVESSSESGTIIAGRFPTT